ncbi:acetate uptake transporter [Catenulispora subtropica]|uniref:acetate uptake transporter n=1 Tax=Catenulispora subtropica TaxID=450798 RepID=UPI0031D2062A
MSETPNAPAPSSGGTADPAPLGLAGFAMTTFILSFVNANLISEKGSGDVILGLALFYGGIAQLLAGMWEYRRGNTFGATAFSSFGAFWLSYWGIVRLGTGGDAHKTIGLYLFAWFLFTGYMTVAATRTNGAVLAVFVLLTITFLCLAIGAWQNAATPPAAMTRIGGWLGILTALAAWYASFAAVVNETHKRQLFPTWPR